MRATRTPIISVLSFLLLVASIAFWVRSHFACDTVGWENTEWHNLHLQSRAFGFQSDTSGLGLFALHRSARFEPNDNLLSHFESINPARRRFYHMSHEPVGYPYMDHYPGFRFLGFGYFAGSTPNVAVLQCADHHLIFPHALVSLLLAIPPARWLIRRPRNSPRLCRACGYDLRASLERCPECEASAPGSAAPTASPACGR